MDNIVAEVDRILMNKKNCILDCKTHFHAQQTVHNDAYHRSEMSKLQKSKLSFRTFLQTIHT